MDTVEFLNAVVTGPVPIIDEPTGPTGRFLLCLRNHTIPWLEQYYAWPDDLDHVLDKIKSVRDNYDIYFTSHLFDEDESTKQHVLPTRTIQADLDNAALDDIPYEPSILVETSPSRYQGYWFIDPKASLELDNLELLSKNLTYSIVNADRTGWSLGHRVRVPGTLNLKYNTGPHEVKVVAASLKEYLPEDLALIEQPSTAILAITDNNFIDTASDITLEIGPQELMATYKTRIAQSVYLEYISGTPSSDRSRSLWALMCSCFEIGLSRDEVFWLAKHSPNNKFALNLRYNADRELAKDILRAEQHVRVKVVDIRSVIDSFRTAPLLPINGAAMFKMRAVHDATVTAMRTQGKFLKVRGGLPYFVLSDTGRPVPMSQGSEHFRALLHTRYGFNSADHDYRYVHSGLLDLGTELDDHNEEGVIAHFDKPENVLYFHNGARDVYRVTTTSVSKVVNGDCGVVFPWYEMLEPFTPDLTNPEENWADAVFGDLHNASNMLPSEAKALLKVWLMFSLFKSGVSTRPLLALFGPPGAGKSTIPHRVYSLFYAKRLAVQGITFPTDFDMASNRLPVYCIDNLDTYVGWILDRLAQAIGDSDNLKRKLFTDVDMIVFRRRAMIAITSHNPKFTREDITSRLLLVSLAEITGHMLKDETAMAQYILDHRPQLWGGIIRDAQRVLATPPVVDASVKWRIQDFCTLGERIAIAVGCREDFNNGLRAMLVTQTDTLLQQDENLISAILAYAHAHVLPEYIPANDLWSALMTYTTNQTSFAKYYKNATVLSRKLQLMQSTLQTLVTISYQVNPATRSKIWSISAKE